MTDKQQIEEMAKVIESVKLYGADNYARKISHDSVLELAKELLKHYQPKVPENAVVLTREEWRDLHKGYGGMLYEIRQEVRKETANDFIFKVESYLGYNDDNETFTKKELLLILAEVAKEQFGVEVEE